MTESHAGCSTINRAGQPLIRFSPHFYNTEAEMDRVARVIGEMA